MRSPEGTSKPAATITVAYDDDASAAAEALLAVLRRPEPELEEEGGTESEKDEAA